MERGNFHFVGRCRCRTITILTCVQLINPLTINSLTEPKQLWNINPNTQQKIKFPILKQISFNIFTLLFIFPQYKNDTQNIKIIIDISKTLLDCVLKLAHFVSCFVLVYRIVKFIYNLSSHAVTIDLQYVSKMHLVVSSFELKWLWCKIGNPFINKI